MTDWGTPYNLTPNGRAHIVLAKLEGRPAHFGHLAEALGVRRKVEGRNARRGPRRRLHELLVFLRGADLIMQDSGNWYHLTTHGADVLADLDAAARSLAA